MYTNNLIDDDANPPKKRKTNEPELPLISGTNNLIESARPLKRRNTNDSELQLISGDEEDPSKRNLRHGENDRDPNDKTLPMPPTDQVEDEEEGYRQLSIRSAKLALDDFNKGNNTKYVLVIDQTLASNNFNDHRGFWTHCCFYAKDSSMKQFFAEIRSFHLSEPEVICMILEGKTCVGCEYCSSFIIHPIDGYQAGCSSHSPHSSRSISDHNKDPLMGPNLEVVEDLSDRETKYDSYSRPSRPSNYEGWLAYNVKYGNLALDSYNKENNTKFELLVDDKTMVCNAFIGGDGVVVHSTFNAQEDSSVRQFFSETQYDHSLRKLVPLCIMLKEGQTRMGCYACTSFIHPIDGFKIGCLIDDGDALMDPNLNMNLVENVKDSENKTPDSPPDSPPYSPISPPYEPVSPPYSPVYPR